MSNKREILTKIPDAGGVITARFAFDTYPKFAEYTVMYKSNEHVILRCEDGDTPFEISYEASELVDFGIELK